MKTNTDKSEKIKIKVRMLGDFSVVYDGQKICLGKRSNCKFVQLLQLVWLSGEKGISKEEAVRALYDEIDLANVNNSMNNLLYQLRIQLARAGVPKGDYIVYSGGLYLPDQRFVIELDVDEFLKRIADAHQAEQENVKLACYRTAYELYCGELLPMISTELWVLVESMRLKSIYEECVEWLERYYKERQEYKILEKLYDRSAKIYPCDKWNIRQIELLVDREEYRDAYDLYNKMIREYTDIMGLSPTKEMLKCYERISGGIRRMPQSIENIRQEIQDYISPEKTMGASFCSYRSFIDICYVYKNSMERTGRSIFVMMCTMLDYKGKSIQDPDKLRDFSDFFKNVLCISLRKEDAFTQYSASQYLVLLSGLHQENCETIQQRINLKLKEELDRRMVVEYATMSLTDLMNP